MPPVTPDQASGWTKVMQEAGPYGIILCLLVVIWGLIIYIRSLHKDKDELHRAWREDVANINRALLEDSKESTAATIKLTTILEHRLGKRRQGGSEHELD